MKHLVALACLPLVLAAGCGFLPKKARDTKQAIWVTRWDFKTESDVRDLVRKCAEGGFDTVLFQVRGNGTVLYRSKLEPWAEELNFRDPGFDPLGVACDEARRQGIMLQAWVNAVPGWRGDRPPAHDQQLYQTHPDWFLLDQNQKRQDLKKDEYVALNPCLPAVRDYVARICEEIALRYPVDGIHLDYIRFLEKEAGRDFPYDRQTIELYRQATGKAPADDPDGWSSWKTAQVTQLVREIRTKVRRANSRCVLTAAVYSTPALAMTVNQDWAAWLADGLVDGVFPMTYDEDDGRFTERVRAQKEAAGDSPVVVGIGAYRHKDPGQTLRQMSIAREAGLQGYSLFAYSSFFGSKNKPAAEAPKPEVEAAEATVRVQRREKILPRVQSARVMQ